VRLSEANEARDCDLLSDPIIEEALLSARFRRPSRLVRPEGNFSDLTAADVVGFRPRRPCFPGLRFEDALSACSSMVTSNGESGSPRGLTSRSGRTGLAGRGPPAVLAFGVHGV
jgi:hypothetical protein